MVTESLQTSDTIQHIVEIHSLFWFNNKLFYLELNYVVVSLIFEILFVH